MSEVVLFKWESNNRGLDHKCGTCKTVLSSPRAKKTCFGVHEEVCPKYHKTLFYLGNSHKCDACRKSTMLHVKRHREIASLAQDILLLDNAREDTSLSLDRKKARKDDGLSFSKMDIDFSESGHSEGWPDTSTVCDDDDSREGQISGLTESKNYMDSMRTQKAGRKTIKCQSRFQVTTAEELQRIQEALHPARDPLSDKKDGNLKSNGLLNNATIDSNIAFNTHFSQHPAFRSAMRQKKLEENNYIVSTPRSRTTFDDSQMSAIFRRLGISTRAVSNHTKERTSRLVRLRDAIEKDLLCVENEDRETMTRMAGYWRYANRRTYNAMVRNNQLWDWATGAKLEEIEEEAESELDSTENDDDQRWPGCSESDGFMGTPHVESWDDDFISDSNNPLNLANMPAGGFEQRGQMLHNPAINSAEILRKSDIAEESPVLATSVTTAAIANMKKGSKSPWDGVKDTRRQSRPTTSPPSPRKKMLISLPRVRSPLKKSSSNRRHKYIPLGISYTISTARTKKSTADLRSPQRPKRKTPRRKTDPDPQDDDSIRVPATVVHANSVSTVAAPFKDPNNRFSLLL